MTLSIHRTATDRRWEMSHSNTPPVRNWAPLTARSSSLWCVSAAEHQTAEQYSKTGITKPQKHLQRSDLSWNIRQDFLKIPSLCETALETKRRCLGMHCAKPRDYHSLCLTCNQLHPPKVTPLTNPAKITDQGLCYCNSDAWGWHNSHQSGVISITDLLIFKNGKKLQSAQEEYNGLKTLPCSTPDTTLTSLLWQPSTITYCDRFDRNCINIDRTEPPIPTEQSL